MIKHAKIVQGSAEWYALRSGIPTASEWGVLVTSKTLKQTKKRPSPVVVLEPSKGVGVKTYLYRKLASRWLGRPLETTFIGGAVEQGKLLEEEAVPRFELDTGIETERVGFVTRDDGRYGCSPDALIPNSGAEIKCPLPETHAGYLLENRVPPDYVPQIQGSMLVTGASSWWFMSYARNFPPLILNVPRDEAYIAVLSESLDLFSQKLDAAYATLVALNGGEPKRIVMPTNDMIEEYYGEVPNEDEFLEFLNEGK